MRMFCVPVFVILAVYIITESEPFLITMKRKFWVKKSIEYRFLKPPAIVNSCFIVWRKKDIYDCSFVRPQL
jgi:hypothetical protein